MDAFLSLQVNYHLVALSWYQGYILREQVHVHPLYLHRGEIQYPAVFIRFLGMGRCTS